MEPGIRLEDFCRQTFAVLASKRHARNAIARGDVRVNGEVAERTRRLPEGSSVQLRLSAFAAVGDRCPERIRPRVIFEDESLA
eukprot:9501904-Pyramimonas_sp.AAC.1